MLSKLLKYEIKATARTFLPMYALSLAFALINKFFITVNKDYMRIPQIISMTIFVFLIVGICVMTLVVCIQRFQKNLLSDEGYLSFTLPVKAHSHIDCKMIVTLMWAVLSALVSFLSIFIMAVDSNTMEEIRQGAQELFAALNEYGASSYLILFELVVLLLASVLNQTVSIYAAIVVGNLSSKHKLLAGVGAYLGFGVVEQIVVSVFISIFGSDFARFFDSFGLHSPAQQLNALQLFLLISLAFVLVFGTAFYFLTDWMLKKKLNLE